MNKINSLFNNSKDKKLLSLYFCAGCPTLDGTADVILTMQRRGIAMIEVGIPFSDPLADGPVIQSAATQALKNGMTLTKLLSLFHPPFFLLLLHILLFFLFLWVNLALHHVIKEILLYFLNYFDFHHKLK